VHGQFGLCGGGGVIHASSQREAAKCGFLQERQPVMRMGLQRPLWALLELVVELVVELVLLARFLLQVAWLLLRSFFTPRCVVEHQVVPRFERLFLLAGHPLLFGFVPSIGKLLGTALCPSTQQFDLLFLS